MSKKNKPIAVLFMTLLLVMMGFGIVIPIFPFLIVDLGGGATALGFFMAAYSIMQFICAPFWGSLSDRIGRRPVLLIGLVGYGVTFTLFGFVSDLWMMFAIRVLSGILSSATLPTAMAYIADTTSGAERSKGMGILGAAMGLGMIIGPAMGGWLSNDNFALPFFVAGGLAVLTLPFAIWFLPESLSESRKNTPDEKAVITLEVIKQPLFMVFLICFVFNFTSSLFQGTFALFAADKVGFGPKEMGILFAVLGIVSVIIQGGLVGRLVKRFGDVKLVKAGLLIGSTGMLLMLMATNVLGLYVTSAIFNIGWTLLGPTSSSLVTQNASGGQGVALGIMQSFSSFGRIFGPMVGGVLYDIQMNIPYALGTVSMLLMVLFSVNKLSFLDGEKATDSIQ
ncbi:Tetracycline resistance protein, class B [Sporotomaculum syntrophicum]|uniref:Tetracycline resistance protein, class B n=1 Tax=Sporotomaculum syntrophicum TaxID=182264 RepID=A0A9D2WNW4_9FIRM|nr:MFS transporter [Sporotomaculum syntrophicum]KAF1084196.1 Tetracycline resistance protein, class B [Sporotomaculum syntrophicum]